MGDFIGFIIWTAFVWWLARDYYYKPFNDARTVEWCLDGKHNFQQTGTSPAPEICTKCGLENTNE